MNLRALWHKAATTKTASAAAPVIAADDKALATRVRATLDAAERAARLAPMPAGSDETARVVALPQISYEGVDWTERLRRPGGTMLLRDVQSSALEAIHDCHGGFFPIGTGWGKSLVAVLAGTVLDADLALLFTPASTVTTLRGSYFEARRHFRTVPLQIHSTESLSQPNDGKELLEALVEGLDLSRVVLVFDEAHALKDFGAARTKRVARFIERHPEMACVFLSGTMTDKSVTDCAHLAAWALRHWSPLPRDNRHLGAWSECLDVKGRPTPDDWGVFRPLWDAFAEQAFESSRGETRAMAARRAWQARLRSCPGVVCSSEASLTTKLRITGIADVAMNAKVNTATVGVDDSGESPDGEILPDDASRWRILRQLAQGFYYTWAWPDGAVDADWLRARRNWFKHVRGELLRRAGPGYDSPLLVWQAVGREVLRHASNVAVTLLAGDGLEAADADTAMIRDPDAVKRACRKSRLPCDAWIDWALQKHKAHPPTVPVWLDGTLMDHAVAWAKAQPTPAILWYDTRAVGEALAKRGVPVFGAGTEPPARAVTCGMAIQAHGIGKNLHHWHRQLVVSPPAGGKTWEQMLARTHRPGQTADCVDAAVYQHADSFVQALATAREVAKYVEAAAGNAQRLLLAEYVNVHVRGLVVDKVARAV